MVSSPVRTPSSRVADRLELVSRPPASNTSTGSGRLSMVAWAADCASSSSPRLLSR